MIVNNEILCVLMFGNFDSVDALGSDKVTPLIIACPTVQDSREQRIVGSEG